MANDSTPSISGQTQEVVRDHQILFKVFLSENLLTHNEGDLVVILVYPVGIPTNLSDTRHLFTKLNFYKSN